jgi:hypothetical protein
MLTMSLWHIFKSHRLLSEIALQVAVNTAYLCNMALILGYCFRDRFTGGGGHPPRGAIFHDQAKNNRDRMRYSNLSNNMMITKLWITITIQIQYVDGRAAHMTDTTLHQSWQSSPLPDHAGSIPVLFTWRWIQDMFYVNFQVTIQFFRWLFNSQLNGRLVIYHAVRERNLLCRGRGMKLTFLQGPCWGYW